MYNQDIKNKLYNLGIYPTVGVRGPKGDKGDSLKILGSYESYEELVENHPTGVVGDCYLINGILYFWNDEKGIWDEASKIIGPTGPSEKIKIENTITGDAESNANVIDNFDGATHNLSFLIPKGRNGDKGDVGPTGPKGDKGDIGPAGPLNTLPTSYDGIIFASFAQANYSKIMAFQETLGIPENDDYFELSDNTNIKVMNPGIYEITLCGQISGVDQSHGAIFYLSNTNGAVIQDLSFEVKAGTTTRMVCSETIITKFDDAPTLYVRCGVIGDSSTANVDFTNVNLIIKKYHITV